MVLNWGIVSVGLISHDFLNALRTLSPDDHKVVAVAARDVNRAYEFAKKFEIHKAYGSYLQLAQDPEVKIAYVRWSY